MVRRSAPRTNTVFSVRMTKPPKALGGSERTRPPCQLITAASGCIVLPSRVGPLSFGERLFGRTCVEQHAEQPEVAFMATTFEHERGLVVALLQLLQGTPWPRPSRRVFGGELDGQRVRVNSPEALDEVEVFPRAVEVRF